MSETKVQETEEEVVLRLLSDKSLYGLDLVKRSNDVLKRGSVYMLLNRMEHDGLVSSRAMPNVRSDLLPRRLYSLTDAGVKAAGKARRRGGERRLRYDLAGVVRKHGSEVAEQALQAAGDEESAAMARALVSRLRLHLPAEAVGDVAHALVREALGSPPAASADAG